jgi:outer membrane protein
MNKVTLKLSFLIPIVWMLTGCTQVPEQDRFYELKVPDSRVRQIDTIDFNSVQKPTAKLRPEANEPGPKQIPISLQEVRALTLANNLDVKAQLISPSIAAQSVSEEEARFEATFFTDFLFDKTDHPVSTELEGSSTENIATNLGVKLPLRTGGTITAELLDDRFKTNDQFSTLNPAYTADMAFSISQPLLRNAGTRVNTNAIRIANYDLQIVNARTKLQIINVLADADMAYWRFYSARRQLELRKDAYDWAIAQLETAKRLVEAGQVAKVEIIRAEAGAAQRLEAIILAENNFRQRQRELKRIMNKPGLNVDTPEALTPATEPDPVHYDLDSNRLIANALSGRMELLETELELAKEVSMIDFSQNQTLPLFDVTYRYTMNGLGANRSDAYDTLFDKNFEDNRVSVNLQVPLGNEAAKSRLRQAIYVHRQQLVNRDNRSSLIEYEVLNAVDQLDTAWQSILAARQNSILQGRLLEAEKHQFEIGLRTSTDVLAAQANLADAQSTEIIALAEYQIAQDNIAVATGTMLGAAKIEWEPTVPAQ